MGGSPLSTISTTTSTVIVCSTDFPDLSAQRVWTVPCISLWCPSIPSHSGNPESRFNRPSVGHYTSEPSSGQNAVFPHFHPATRSGRLGVPLQTIMEWSGYCMLDIGHGYLRRQRIALGLIFVRFSRWPALAPATIVRWIEVSLMLEHPSNSVEFVNFCPQKVWRARVPNVCANKIRHVTPRAACFLHAVVPILAMTSTSNSSIFNNGRLRQGTYKIQNLHTRTYADINESTREMFCYPAKDLEEGSGIVRPYPIPAVHS